MLRNEKRVNKSTSGCGAYCGASAIYIIGIGVRIKDSHPYILVMSQLCYYYINPHIYFYLYFLQKVEYPF